MNKADIIELTELAEKLETLLRSNIESTVALMACDTEETASLDEIITQRQTFVDKMLAVRTRIDEIIAKQDGKTAELLKTMFSHKDDKVMSIPAELKELNTAVVSLRSQHRLSVAQETALTKQFESRYDELKETLVSLNNDKKKINMMSSLANKMASIGGSFDSRS